MLAVMQQHRNMLLGKIKNSIDFRDRVQAALLDDIEPGVDD